MLHPVGSSGGILSRKILKNNEVFGKLDFRYSEANPACFNILTFCNLGGSKKSPKPKSFPHPPARTAPAPLVRSLARLSGKLQTGVWFKLEIIVTLFLKCDHNAGKEQ